MYSVDHCPICSSREFTSYGQAKDYTVSHETFQLVRCISCDFLITSPRPEDSQLGKYYESPDYISHSAKATTAFDKLYAISRELALSWKLTLVKKFTPTPNPSLLDYGCGTGFFLRKMKQNGFNIAGVEPSMVARTHAEKITSTQIHQRIEAVQQDFDVISLWHVLEHVSNLNELIKQLKAHLNQNGILMIAVPNYKSEDAKKYGTIWAGFDVPRHLWHFEQNTMKKLLANHGLRIKAVVPMKLDAFYVSILSEKYRAGKQSISTFARGFMAGLLSNFKAKEKNYSSIIYIVHHE